jgi:hypothetical protein
VGAETEYGGYLKTQTVPLEYVSRFHILVGMRIGLSETTPRTCNPS